MSGPTNSYATPTEAIRVFCGFPNRQLTPEKFLSKLGQTFMPGTPYMLQPMGLAAYLPGVLSEPPPDAPREFALICYPSQAVWKQIMNNTLRGRLYNLTHDGTYAFPPSSAAFPTLLDNLPSESKDPFFLFSSNVDWQGGVTHVAVGAKKDIDQTGEEFRLSVRNELLSRRETMAGDHIDQVIATVGDTYAILWFHGEMNELGRGADFLGNLFSQPTIMRNERVICVDEPPTVTITGSQAFNFIFLRDQRYFLV
jgi:hypothetical protein